MEQWSDMCTAILEGQTNYSIHCLVSNTKLNVWRHPPWKLQHVSLHHSTILSPRQRETLNRFHTQQPPERHQNNPLHDQRAKVLSPNRGTHFTQRAVTPKYAWHAVIFRTHTESSWAATVRRTKKAGTHLYNSWALGVVPNFFCCHLKAKRYKPPPSYVPLGLE